jgi:hypothetical protein
VQGGRRRECRSPVGLDRRLHHLLSGAALIHPAVTITKTALEVLAGILFILAVAACWIFERARAEDLVLSLIPRRNRKVARDTWRDSSDVRPDAPLG